MMDFINSLQAGTGTIGSGRSLTVSAPPTGLVIVNISRSGNNIQPDTTLTNGQISTFGPYNYDVNYRVTAARGIATVSQQDALTQIGSPSAAVTTALDGKLPPAGYRTALLGDSYFGLGFFQPTITTTAGSFVVANGIATITTTGNHNALPGNYISFVNLFDPTLAASLNGACVQILTVTSSTVFTVSATFNGQTMANGDYSSSLGGAWNAYLLYSGTDSSHYHWHNYFNLNPFVTVALNGYVQLTSQMLLTLMPKILAGPAFDIAWMNIGANDFGSIPTPTQAQILQVGQQVLNNTIAMCSQLTAIGKLVILCTPCPVGTGLGGGSIQIRNIGIAQLRQGLLKYAQTNPGVRILDTFRDSIAGTAANGDYATNFGNLADGIHLSSYGCYQVAKYENAANTFVPISKVIDTEPVTLLEDNSTFAQSFSAWAATTAYAPTSVITSIGAYSIPVVVRSGGNLYLLTTPGTSDGVGPTGTGSGITDGTCVWAYQGALQYNCIPNGMMSGSGGTNQAGGGFTGSIPAGYFLAAFTGAPTVVGTSAQARAALANTNQANLGFGWGLAITWTAAGTAQVVSFNTNDISGQLATGVGQPALGGWYRFGVNVAATGAVAGVASIALNLNIGGSPWAFSVYAGNSGNNTSSLPLVSGDQYQLLSEPVYIAPGTITSGGAFIYCRVTSIPTTAGVANLQFSSLKLTQVESPYAPTPFGI